MNSRLRWTRWVILAGLFLAVVAAYAGAVTNGFLYDDYHLIAENPAVVTHDWVAVWTSGDAASRDRAGRGFRPATISSYVLDHAVGSGGPFVYHATQLGLHVVVVSLVYLVGTAVGLAPWWAAAAGLLVGLHPVQTEAVHYLSARSSVLSTLWLLAAIWFYLRSRERLGGGRGWFVGSLMCVALAVWSKESAVVGIVWFVAYERLRAGATWADVTRRVWLHVATGLVSVLPAVIVLRGSGGASVAAGMATATGVGAIGRHVWAMLVPVDLGPVSPQPWVGWGEPAVWGSAALALAVCAAGYALRTRVPVFTWGVACGVSGLAPVLALPFVTNVGLVQPHRGYQAMAGFALAIAAGLEAWANRVRTSTVRTDSGQRLLRNACVAFVLIVTVVLVAADVSAGRVWRDEVGFWARAVEQYPGEAAYHQSLGAARLRAGNLPGALDALFRAAALDPELPRVSYNLGLVYAKLGRIDEAIAAYRRAVATDASDVKALANLGWLFEKRGESDRALAAYRAALRVAPDLPRVRERVAALALAGSTDQIGGPTEAGRP